MEDSFKQKYKWPRSTGRVLSLSNRGIKMRRMSFPRDRLVWLDKLFKGNTARSANVWNLKQEILLLGINFYRNMEKHRNNKKKS